MIGENNKNKVINKMRICIRSYLCEKDEIHIESGDFVFSVLFSNNISYFHFHFIQYILGVRWNKYWLEKLLSRNTHGNFKVVNYKCCCK